MEEWDEEPIEGFFTDVWTAEKVPPEWVVEDILPVGIGILAAPPKSLKSTLTYCLTALVNGYKTNALPPSLSKVVEEGAVVLFSYEATAGEVRDALEEGVGVKGVPNQTLLVADDPWKWRLDEEGSVEQMLSWLNKLAPKLVILDPLRNFHSLDERDSGIVRLLEPFRRWAKENKATFLVVHHTRKPNEDQRTFTSNDVRGTSALFGMVDYSIILTPVDIDSGTVRAIATFKRAKGWEREIQMQVYAAVAPLSDVDQLVLQLLSGGPMKGSDMNKQLRLGKGLKEVLDSLLQRGHVRKRKMYWYAVKKEQ